VATDVSVVTWRSCFLIAEPVHEGLEMLVACTDGLDLVRSVLCAYSV
jgi:hypothetical protein